MVDHLEKEQLQEVEINQLRPSTPPAQKVEHAQSEAAPKDGEQILKEAREEEARR